MKKFQVKDRVRVLRLGKPYEGRTGVVTRYQINGYWAELNGYSGEVFFHPYELEPVTLERLFEEGDRIRYKGRLDQAAKQVLFLQETYQKNCRDYVDLRKRNKTLEAERGLRRTNISELKRELYKVNHRNRRLHKSREAFQKQLNSDRYAYLSSIRDREIAIRKLEAEARELQARIDKLTVTCEELESREVITQCPNCYNRFLVPELLETNHDEIIPEDQREEDGGS